MSKVNVNTIEPSTGTDITLGASGDTITVPSGATITNSGTSTGFGPTLTGSTNNQVVTVTGANAITGETNLVYDGTTLVVNGTSSAGSSSTANDLQIGNAGANEGMTIYSATDGTGRVQFSDGTSGLAQYIGQLRYDHSDNSLQMHVNDAERMRITSAGDLLIGCTSKANTNAYFEIKTNSRSQLNLGSSSTAGTDIAAFRNPNGAVGYISTDGSATAFATSSDYRLKENQIDITDGIDRIKQLKPYKFNFKVDADKTVDGFFAHEVSSIIPEAIIGEKDEIEKNEDGTNKLDDDGNTIPKHQGIDQSKLVPLLVAAVKELTAKVEALENK